MMKIFSFDKDIIKQLRHDATKRKKEKKLLYSHL